MRVVFVGTGEIGVPTLRALLRSEHELVGVVTQPDKPVGRDQRIAAPPVKAAASKFNVPILQPPKIKDEAAVEQIRAFEPDLMVVMAYGQILPRSVLQIPKRGCLNLHASLLPHWRGAAPIQASIAAGDTVTGLTVMYMDEGLDTGDILLQKEIQVSPDETGGTLHDRLADLAPAALLEALELIENGKAPRVAQDSARASYAPKLSRESGRINWLEAADVIERKIRAFNPWPGSFTELETPTGGRKLKVFSAKVADGSGPPGQILSGNNQLLVATGTQPLSLAEVQLEGRKRMSAAELIRGNKWIEQLQSVGAGQGTTN